MNDFASILVALKIDPDVLVRRSAVIERKRAGGSKRWRGVSRGLVEKALRGWDPPRRVRAKLLRALDDLAPTSRFSWAAALPRRGTTASAAPVTETAREPALAS